MNKLAIAIAALSLSAGAAFAENPDFGRADSQSALKAGQMIDRSTTASVKDGSAQEVASNYSSQDRARYGDGAPYANR
jgi:hypothetical protein